MSEWRSDFLAISSTSLFLDLAKVSCLTLIWMKKIDIVKGDLEEFLEKNLPNLLQLCQLLEPFHHYLQIPFKLKHKYTSNYYIIQKQPSRVGISTRIAGDNSGRTDFSGHRQDIISKI